MARVYDGHDRFSSARRGVRPLSWQSLAFASSEDLRVRWRLRLVNEELLSGEHEPGAVYIPHNRAIYVRHGDVFLLGSGRP